MSQLKIKQIRNEDAIPESYIAFDGNKNVWQKMRHTQVIFTSDLDDGVLTIHHGMRRKYVVVTVYDDDDHQVVPDQVRVMDNDIVEIHLTSFASNVDNWVLVIS